MKSSFHHIKGFLGAGLLLMVAASLPQYSLAQRFSHGGGGGGFSRPAPVESRPAPVESRPAPAARPAAPVVNRPAPVQQYHPAPAGAINGGSRNVGNHDFSRAGTAPPPRVVNAQVSEEFRTFCKKA